MTTRTLQAKRIFEGQWISKLLANFDTSYETQQAALAVLWTIMESGSMSNHLILPLMGICEGEDVPEATANLIQEMKYAVCKIQIPVGDTLLPLMVRESNGGARVFNDALTPWENELINAIEEQLPVVFPTSIPAEVHNKQYIDGMWVIKHSVNKFRDQSERTAPMAFKALNVLNKQAYTLNKDMLALHNMVEDLTKPIGSSPIHRLNRLRTLKSFHGVFHFKYTMDFRGRIYARSVIATPQGDSFSKAVLNLAVAKPLGSAGVQALAIHYANQSGMDKASYKERIAWATTEGYVLAQKLAACKGNWMCISPLLTEHDNFEQYTAALDWYRALASGDPQSYRSAIICHQDATNSGFQFGAALLRDNEAAEYVNITDSLGQYDKPADLYGRMAENLVAKLQDKPDWIPHINRKFCKKPIMVTGYGAGAKVVQEDVEKYMVEIGLDKDFEEIKDEFFEALEETVGSMTHITKAMKVHAKDLVDSGAEAISWITPDGFKVWHTYRDTSGRKVQLANNVSAIRKRRKGERDPLSEQMIGALPPNFIHSMDGQMLRTAALKADAVGVAFCPIHDSFGTHAADYWDLHHMLKEAFVETMLHPWYTEFCKRNKQRVSLERMGDYDVRQAARAAYMFS